MDKPYILTIYDAAPGTPLLKEPDPKATSTAGQMYYGLEHGDQKESYGFAPKGHGVMRGPGKVADNDVANHKDPHYARIIEVTKEQYEKLQAFGGNPHKFGFDMTYNGAINSCVDFTWKALNNAGLYAQEKGKPSIDQQGAIKPLNNIDKVKSIAAPLPESTNNKERTNPLPPRSILQRLLSETDPAARADLLAQASQKPDWTINPVVVRDIKDGSYVSLTRDPKHNLLSVERFTGNGEQLGSKISPFTRGDINELSRDRQQPQKSDPQLQLSV